MLSTIGNQPTETFDPHLMGRLGLGIVLQQHVHVVFAVGFRGHVLDTVAVVFGVEGNYIHADCRILFFEFRDVFGLN